MKDMTPQIYGTEHYLHKTIGYWIPKAFIFIECHNEQTNMQPGISTWKIRKAGEMFRIQFDNETEFSFFDSVSYIKASTHKQSSYDKLTEPSNETLEKTKRR